MDLAAGTNARFQFASDQSLLVYFDEQVGQHRSEDWPPQSQSTLQANENVRKLLRLLESEPVAGIRNLHPAYCSMLIKFDALQLRHEEVEAILRKYLERLEEVKLPEPRRVEIAVCYGGEVGPGPGGGGRGGGSTEGEGGGIQGMGRGVGFFFGVFPGFRLLRGCAQEMVKRE